MNTYLMVSGMFRSGTTLMSTILNAHPEMCCAADPYLPTFKLFRNAVAGLHKDRFADVDVKGPLEDYYFEGLKVEFMQHIQSTPLDIELGDLSQEEIRSQTAQYAQEYSPKIVPLLNEMGGETFADVLRSGFEVVNKAYGSPGDRITAIKTAWTDEFAPHVLSSFPEAKVIHVIRDPRATCASKNVLPEKYPWLFLIRQWRKSAAFILDNLREEQPWSDRIMAVRYEDLVADPEKTCMKICSFLEVDFSESMIDVGRFRDGSGKPWTHNSSHYSDGNGRGFITGSVEKWRKVLSESERTFIEYLCGPEMKVWSYGDLQAKERFIPLDLLDVPPEVQSESLARWIRAYAERTTGDKLEQMALENLRLVALHQVEELSERLARKLFLRPAIVRSLSEVWKERVAALEAE